MKLLIFWTKEVIALYLRHSSLKSLILLSLHLIELVEKVLRKGLELL